MKVSMVEGIDSLLRLCTHILLSDRGLLCALFLPSDLDLAVDSSDTSLDITHGLFMLSEDVDGIKVISLSDRGFWAKGWLQIHSPHF